MNANYYAVIMAGGIGSRFWPLSKSKFPKQFHDILGTGKSLIQKTFERIKKITPVENILILTNENYKNLVLSQLKEIKETQIILEPVMKNTAPCILYAALKIQKINPDAVMVVVPSDHWIEDETSFASDITHCFENAQQNKSLYTLGIKPTFPNTGFGYIEYDKTTLETLKKVVQFREKPNYEKAKFFLKQGNFLWNAGIFVWSITTIIDSFIKNQPKTYALFKEGIPTFNTDKEYDFIQENYKKSENISIDYAILEKEKEIKVLPANFDWNDLGTWGALYEQLDKEEQGNAVINAQLILENAKDNLVRTTKNKIVVLHGIQDYIIVDNDDVLLIYPKEKEQNIKQISQKIKESFGEQYA